MLLIRRKARSTATQVRDDGRSATPIDTRGVNRSVWSFRKHVVQSDDGVRRRADPERISENGGRYAVYARMYVCYYRGQRKNTDNIIKRYNT
jgi:hypothetical protein